LKKKRKICQTEKLGELASATKLFQIEERAVGDGPSKAIYLKDKRKK
jgi:hypothetical protein